MTRFTKLPAPAFAIALFVLTGIAAANPMAHLIDCEDSFWAIACADEGEAPGESETDTEIILGEPIAIDNDHVCVEIDGGFFICHT